MLRIVERDGLWIRARVTNGISAATEDDYDRRPRLKPPEPELSDEAVVAALLAAFGSRTVGERHAAWREAVAAINAEFEKVAWNAQEDYPTPPTVDDLSELTEALWPEERAAREALADAIAAELGHR